MKTLIRECTTYQVKNQVLELEMKAIKSCLVKIMQHRIKNQERMEVETKTQEPDAVVESTEMQPLVKDAY